METIRIVVFICLINYGDCQNDTQVQGRSSAFGFAQWTAWAACTAGESCSWKRQHSCSIHNNPSGACGTIAWKEETMECDRCIGAGNNVWIPQGQWSGCFGTGCSDTIQTQMFKCWNHDTQPTCKRKLTRFCPSNLVCDGTWSSWSGTQCSVRCGGGLETNTRQCYKNGRESYNCDSTTTLQIALFESRIIICNVFDCNAVRYTEWGECVCTNGISRRTRECLANCNGVNQESQTCNNPTCTTTTTTTVIPTTVTTPIVTTTTTRTRTTTTTQTTTSTIPTTTTAENYGRINKEIPEIETTATTLEYEHDAQEPTLKSWVNRIIIIAVSALVVGFLASIAIFILCCRKKFRRKQVVYIAGDQTDEVAQYNTLDIQSTLPPVQLYESMTSIHRPSLPNRPLPRTPTSISSSIIITPSASSTIRPPKPPRRNRPNSRPDMNMFFDTLAPPSNPPDTPQMAVSAPVSPTLRINNADVQYSSLKKISGTPDPYLAPIN
nr:mucin-5AC-like [Ciona intestinalis]XP_018668581.1 mucin-5AC-like [Ciona intestinalis]XP_026691273.1 mucin-5AC-like [Ciona intestinalis]|eukprot:XP_018668580.1 mucin-5AC-like [Ciona intestinalis]